MASLRLSHPICEGYLELSQQVYPVCVACLLADIYHPLEALANALHT